MFFSSEFLIILGFIFSIILAFRIFFSSRYEINELTKNQEQQYPYAPYYPPPPKQVSPLEKRRALESQLEKLVKFIIVMVFVSFVALVLLRASESRKNVKTDNQIEQAHKSASNGA